MGANMQRQAVPLMVTEAPIVATGIEHKCAVDSEVCITAKGPALITPRFCDSTFRQRDGNSTADYTFKVCPLQPGHHQPAPIATVGR